MLVTWNINKENEVVSMVEKGAKQHCTDYRLCIQHKKHTEDNKAHRKHSHSEGDGHSLKRGKWRAGTLVNGLKVAKIRSNLHTGQSEYAGDCSLWPWPETLDRCCWSHCRSVPGVAWNQCQQLSLQDSSRRGWWACCTHQWFQLQLVESNNC